MKREPKSSKKHLFGFNEQESRGTAFTEVVSEARASTTRHYMFGLQVSSSRRIRAAGAELPCPKSCPHPQTDGDTQGEKHHMRPDQNPQHHLR
jgi:hypothetical protein